MVGVKAVRDWRPVPVQCSECGAALMRKRHDYANDRPFRNFFCDKQCKGAWQKRAKPVTREWLFREYVDRRRDCYEIGREVRRDPKSVWNWLKDFGIPTRGRGQDPKVQFKKGAPSAFKGHKQKRGADSPFWKGGITADRQAFYASDEWKAVCQLAYGRAKAQCERCGSHRGQEHRFGRKLHAHHLIPFEIKALRASLDNLAILCRPCHLFVHSNANLGGEFIAIPIDTRRIKRGRPKGS